jgi:hypothetical protein
MVISLITSHLSVNCSLRLSSVHRIAHYNYAHCTALLIADKFKEYNPQISSNSRIIYLSS